MHGFGQTVTIIAIAIMLFSFGVTYFAPARLVIVTISVAAACASADLVLTSMMFGGLHVGLALVVGALTSIPAITGSMSGECVRTIRRA